MGYLQPFWQRTLGRSDVPVFGPWTLAVGRLNTITAIPCELDAGIVVLAGFHELPVLFYQVFKPDPVDLAYARFTPARPAGGHARPRRNKPRRGFIFRALGMIIGQPIEVSGKLGALFPLGNAAQLAGFTFLVADATADFLVRWTTTAYQWNGCIPVDFWTKGLNDGLIPPGQVNGFEKDLPWRFTFSTGGPPATGVSITQPEFQDVDLWFKGEVFGRNPLPKTLTCDVWFEAFTTKERIYIAEGLTVHYDQPLAIAGGGYAKGTNIPESWSVKVTTYGGPINFTPETQFSLSTANPPLISYDPP